MNKELLSIFQIILALSLIVLVLIQSKGAGLGSSFGGSMAFYQTRRGVEKIFFYLTIIVSVLFFLTAVIGLVL